MDPSRIVLLVLLAAAGAAAAAAGAVALPHPAAQESSRMQAVRSGHAIAPLQVLNSAVVHPSLPPTAMSTS